MTKDTLWGLALIIAVYPITDLWKETTVRTPEAMTWPSLQDCWGIRGRPPASHGMRAGVLSETLRL